MIQHTRLKLFTSLTFNFHVLDYNSLVLLHFVSLHFSILFYQVPLYPLFCLESFYLLVLWPWPLIFKVKGYTFIPQSEINTVLSATVTKWMQSYTLIFFGCWWFWILFFTVWCYPKSQDKLSIDITTLQGKCGYNIKTQFLEIWLFYD